MYSLGFEGIINKSDFFNRFPNEEICHQYLTSLRWNDDVHSPFDPYSKVYRCKADRFRCRNTGRYFNVRTNTIFHGSKMDLQTWFLAIWTLVVKSPEISASDLARELNVTTKTAWLMQKRIRKEFKIVPKREISQLPLTDWLSQLK